MQLTEYVKFPSNEEAILENRRLFNKAGYGQGAIGLPNIDGAIDCTHVCLVSVNFQTLAETYRNRKGYFSLNVQAIVGPRTEILGLVPEWPGSQHDSRIFQNSRSFIKFQQRQYSGLLVGDAGYPSLPFLLTPFRNPQNEEEERYNNIQSRTRIVVERTFGILKRRFPCLSRGLNLKLITCTSVVAACVILHNLSLQFNDILPELLDDIPISQDNNVQRNIEDTPGDGMVIRKNIVRRMFH
ncbi:putative nuclease HARBI1 [Prorops nasuta]|uniref:putative nuclease HARBI1 n=1 Tax=Prorops nasuta TaxID=863751 RepID=UPI0034CFAEC5